VILAAAGPHASVLLLKFKVRGESFPEDNLSQFSARAKSVIIFAAVVGACALFAGYISFRNYHWARSEIEADPPSPLLKQPESAGIAHVQAVSFVSRSGLHIAAWYVPSENRAAVIVAHGTNSDRASMLDEIRLLSQAGFGVLAFDWPGLGESDGRILWGSEARDALSSAIDWICARADVDPHRVGGLGFSMGGFMLTQVAARDRRLRAITLASAPSDFDSFISLHYTRWGPLSAWPARWALRGSDLFAADHSAVRLIGEISPRPILIIAQSDDFEIPMAMTRKLFESAREPKTLWIIPGNRHGHYAEAAGAEYGRRLQAFFTDNLLGQAEPSNPGYSGDSAKSPAP
jgi:dipeptidyl aminopeptidase/acylaminoacyl peptidase